MVIQLDAETNDTLTTCAAKAAQVATLLGVNVKFYFDRVGYYVTPGETPTVVAARMKANYYAKKKS